MSRILCNRGWIDLGADVIDPAKIDIEWAASVLARVPRYAGQTPRRWSVWSHSAMVADIAEEILPGAWEWGLHHDLHEAYIGDVISPLSRYMGEEFSVKLEELKSRIDIAVWSALGILPSETIREVVRGADRIAWEAEFRAFAELWPGLYKAGVGEMFTGEPNRLVPKYAERVVREIERVR